MSLWQNKFKKAVIKCAPGFGERAVRNMSHAVCESAKLADACSDGSIFCGEVFSEHFMHLVLDLQGTGNMLPISGMDWLA